MNAQVTMEAAIYMQHVLTLPEALDVFVTMDFQEMDLIVLILTNAWMSQIFVKMVHV